MKSLLPRRLFMIIFLSFFLILVGFIKGFGQEPSYICVDSSIYFNASFLAEDSIVLLGNNNGKSLKGHIAQLVDLNSDGQDDLIINFRTNGTTGDKVTGFYVYDNHGLYKCVMNPVALSDWSFAPKEGTKTENVWWQKIKLFKREQDAMGKWRKAQVGVLQYNKNQYMKMPYALPVDDS